MTPAAGLDAFREVWLVDCECSAPPGERPVPTLLVAQELRTGRAFEFWQDELPRMREPPYPVGPDSLLIAYGAAAKLACHLALGWPVPARTLDLQVEFRRRTAGLSLQYGSGLMGALSWHRLPSMEAGLKEALRPSGEDQPFELPIKREALLGYCESGVGALACLLPVMAPEIEWPRALLRGRYMAAVAQIVQTGIPIDTDMLARLRAEWVGLQAALIREVDKRFGVFHGRTFKADRWERWVADRGIAWPRQGSGALALDDDTFREMARRDPDVALMHELRVSLSQLRLSDLAVGSDGRNRTPLNPFSSRTGRNQPSSSRFIFGPATWLRGLIRPEPGRGLAIIDWSQQEFGIAAALSGDRNMMDAYQTGDPYLALGKQTGLIPPEGTRESHRLAREMCKACVLGVQYGMGAASLAQRIGQPEAMGRILLRYHREAFPQFWAWSDAAENHALLFGTLHTAFGWTLHVGPEVNPRSLRNFPCQANGAEMMRMACCLATERGISVCAPIHDALLVEGSADDIDNVVTSTQEAMAEASELVLSGFRLRTDPKIVRWPARYMDDRGRGMWERVTRLISAGPSGVTL